MNGGPPVLKPQRGAQHWYAPLSGVGRWRQPPAAAPPGVPAYLRTALAAAVQRRHRLGLADPEGGARLVQAGRAGGVVIVYFLRPVFPRS